jgi:hypothetical protein
MFVVLFMFLRAKVRNFDELKHKNAIFYADMTRHGHDSQQHAADEAVGQVFEKA